MDGVVASPQSDSAAAVEPRRRFFPVRPGRTRKWWSILTGRLEGARSLDPSMDAVTGAVNRVLPPGPVKNVLHGTWLGHQLHPILVTLPIGMFVSVSLLDAAARYTGDDGSRTAARKLVGAGLLTVAPTVAAGAADWSSLGDFREPRRIGFVHAGLNAAAAALYGASWYARRRGHHERGAMLALAGGLGLVASGYLGGHMSYAQGVGVNRNADSKKEPREWTDAVAASEVPEGASHRVEIADQPVMLSRVNGTVYALSARCSHYGGPLHEGRFEDSSDPCVVCPWHGSRFHLADGGVAGGPATVPLLSYDVRAVDGRLQVRARR